MRAFSLSISYVLLFITTCIIFGCTSPATPSKVNHGFYYWRSSFHLSSQERKTLQDLSVQQLFIKFFDVEWEEELKQPYPIAIIRMRDSIPDSVAITPVVFITNETLQKADTSHIHTLAVNITKLLSDIIVNNQINTSNEIQIDCDWTVSTKDKYFGLLKSLKQQPFFDQKKLSATIRLHQLKFTNQTGIPPVDKGLLMCYNMGNLRSASTGNSIIETSELDKYVKGLRNYPLHLDVALPLFDWYVWFSKNQYKGLFYPQQLPLSSNKEKVTFARDTVINGYAFKAGDWLRYENSPINVLEAVAQRLKNKLPAEERTILLYHLDEKVLSKYQNNEIKTLLERFH
ncbi:hypothetical protein [Flavisolibacter tropicus]|uniref:hypothetical protein n=1 Tax=Flavisolibacter tropicus TaxID=1492898 RepID=UPI00082FC69D|nr:hypothetical protein [Flavisolibacter tropicus]